MFDLRVAIGSLCVTRVKNKQEQLFWCGRVRMDAAAQGTLAVCLNEQCCGVYSLRTKTVRLCMRVNQACACLPVPVPEHAS